MDFASIRADLVDLVRQHIALSEPLVFGLGFAEGIPGLSLLIPSSALFLAIGGLHSSAGGHFWHLWLAASAGAVLGDCVTYSLGRLLRHDLTRLHAIGISERALEAGQRTFERWGPLAVLAGKFTGFARPFVPVVAGIVAMPWPLFFAASTVSSLAWAGAFLAPGYGLTFLID